MRANIRSMHRRGFLGAAVGVTSAWAAPMAFAAGGRSNDTRDAGQGRLILVFLRGAYDGLSVLVPIADRDYYALRPTIAIAPPDGTDQSALKLDDQFGLHPAMAPVLPLWKQGVLTVLPAAGSPADTRSHFEAQHDWEVGIPGQRAHTAGWMNQLAGRQNNTNSNQTDAVVALAVGEANPAILAGDAPVQRVARGIAATRSGALANTHARQAVLSLYAGNDALPRGFRAGAESRMQTADTLSMANTLQAAPAMQAKEMQAANNGAAPAYSLLQDSRHLATLMQANRSLRLGFLSAGGWDTHANQGNHSGTLANNLASLANALAQLRRTFSEPDDVVLVASEFGRTCAENGSRGTDHGHGNTMWLIGSRVQGGRWHGGWSGLASGNLHENRDLPVFNDYRAVIAQVLRATHGMTGSELDRLFPGFAWDRSLDGLLRA